MSKRYTQVPIDYLEPIFEIWRETYKRGDVLNVFFAPKGDILFRALQFTDWMTEVNKEKVRLVNFDTELIVNPENLAKLLEDTTREKLILVAGRGLMNPTGKYMAAGIEQWYAKHAKGLVILHEGLPIEMDQYFQTPVMQHKRLIHSLYPVEVSKKYTREMKKELGVEVDEGWVERVVEYCGGFPWLINDVLRRSKDDNLFDDEAFKWKVEQIANGLPKLAGAREQEIEMGLRNQEGEYFPALKAYFTNRSKTELEICSKSIVYKHKDISSNFSRGEIRILDSLKSRGGVVSREELGDAFWGEEAASEYSDWALDAIMSRLRKKIEKFELPLVVKTRRGSGYGLS